MATIETNRLELHELLVTILGNRNVYFQPPSSIKMKYPAIVYSRSKIDDKNANNDVCKFDRSFSSDNLNHNVFTLYY